MAKHHRKRNYSKKSTKNHQTATLEPPKAPELTEEEFENCQSYSLLEKILYGGATPIKESPEENIEESSDDQADERPSDGEENINQEEN